MMVGDNIYHRRSPTEPWRQEDSHHSLPDGKLNPHNVSNDTQTDAVLVGDVFFYFGASAPFIPKSLLAAIGYKNGRSYRKFAMNTAASKLIKWLTTTYAGAENTLLGDPFDFGNSSARYSAHTNKVSV